MKTPLPSTLNVALGSLIPCLSGHAGEFGQLGIKQHLLAAEDDNRLRDALERRYRFRARRLSLRINEVLLFLALTSVGSSRIVHSAPECPLRPSHTQGM